MILNFKNLLKDRRYQMWFSLLIISLIGIITMFISTYIYGSADRTYWKEAFILFLYFTFISNIFAVVISSLVVFNKIPLGNKHIQRSKVMMVVNLTITSIIFWAVLSGKIASYGPVAMTSTIIVHTITPTFAIFVFFYEGIKTKILDKDKISPKTTTIINVSMPFIWMVMATVVYLSLGMDKEAAIYSFLDFKGNWIMSLIIIPSIAITYPALTYLYAWLYNK